MRPRERERKAIGAAIIPQNDQLCYSGDITKILFLITKGNWGGAQRYVYDLATNLPPADFETTVACGAGHALPDRLAAAGIRIIRLSQLERDINLAQEVKTFFALWQLFRRERPDVIHLNSSKMGGLGALAARLAGVPRIIFTAHGWAWNESRSALSRRLIWLASWLTALLCHNVITITHSDYEAGRALPGCSGKMHFIPNGLTPPAFLGQYDARESLRRREPRLSTDPLTVWIGTIAELTPNKNVAFLIRALARLPGDNWQAVIIGDGEERVALSDLIAHYNLESKVFLLGFMSEAARYLKALDLFTLTSLKEGLPYVVLEAGAAALPVIATRVGGLPDMITNAQTGRLIPSGDQAALRDALLELLHDHRLRLELGDAIHTALTPLTQQAMAEQTILLYTKSN